MAASPYLDLDEDRAPDADGDRPRGASLTAAAEPEWIDVCALCDLHPDFGAPALVRGKQIALVRVGEADEVYALSNFDPFSQAFVIARGIVGDRGGRAKIASPIYKQSFDLGTGACLDDPSVTLATYPVRVRAGRVEVAFL